MSDCVGAPRMPVCRENYPFVCSTIKSPAKVPIEFAIENGASARIVFLNYQSQKHKHQRSRSRQHVFTALLDNVNVHRAAANSLNIETRAARGSVCNVLLSCVYVRDFYANYTADSRSRPSPASRVPVQVNSADTSNTKNETLDSHRICTFW